MAEKCTIQNDQDCVGCGECVGVLELDPVNKCEGCLGENCGCCIEDRNGNPTEYSSIPDCD